MRISYSKTILFVAIFTLLVGGAMPQACVSSTHADEAQKTRIEGVAIKSKSARSAEDYSAIIATCDEILTEDIENPKHKSYLKNLKSWAHNCRGEVRFELAKQLRRIENHSQADQAMEKALSDFNASISSDGKRWRAFLNRGAIHCSKIDYEPALHDFTEVVRLNPTSANGWFNRAEINYELKNYDDALRDYEESLKLSPGELQAMNGRAHTYFQLGEFEKALEDYNVIVKMKQDSAWALANRADLYQAMGEWAKADQDYVKALKIKPIGAIYQRFAWMLSTCPSDEFLIPKMALACINRAMAADGESPLYLETQAAAHAANGDFELALEAQSKAAKLAGRESQTMRVRKAMYEKGEYYQQEVIRR